MLAGLTIQGQEIDSINEYYVAKALERLGLDFIYQYEIFGGSRRRGGQVIDFLVLKPPLPIPLYVQGRYWHSGARATEDALKQMRLAELTQGRFDRPVLIWEDECETEEQALATVRGKIGWM